MKYKAAKMRNQRSLVTENVLFVPEDILCVILSWLEEKYMLRCKSVCKVWYAVILKNMKFIDMHAIHNGCRFHIIEHQPNYLTIDMRTGLDLDSNKKKKEFRYLSHLSCRGLLVAGLSRAPTKPATKYRICNPTTNRVLDLPRPHKGVITMRVFLNSSMNSYNVVSLYYDLEKKINLELLDLGGQSNDPCPNEDLSWRTLNIPEYDEANSTLQEYYCRHCISEEGILFVIALLKVGSSSPKILCVDLVQQACTNLNAPESLHFEYCEINFQLWRGKPALSFVSEEKLNVWILEDYKKQKWADPILIPLPSLNKYPRLKKQIPQIYQYNEEDFLVYTHDFYFNRIKGYGVCKIDSEILGYALTSPPTRVPATFVSVKGMRPKNKKRRTEHQITTRFVTWIVYPGPESTIH